MLGVGADIDRFFTDLLSHSSMCSKLGTGHEVLEQGGNSLHQAVNKLGQLGIGIDESVQKDKANGLTDIFFLKEGFFDSGMICIVNDFLEKPIDSRS